MKLSKIVLLCLFASVVLVSAVGLADAPASTSQLYAHDPNDSEPGGL